MASDTSFYRTGDGVLARVRKAGAAVPEVFHETTRKWAPYPELDTIHDARPIEPADAVNVPDDPISMGDLESTGDSGDFGDVYESERAPLRR